MKKIREFLCTTHPGYLAFWTIMISVLIGQVVWMGWALVYAFIAFAVCCVVLGAIGYGLYKLIEWAQSHCKESEDE